MYGFDSSRNVLTVNSGSLVYNSLNSYMFVMETSYLNSVYGQTVLIQVTNSLTLPIATLKYKKLNIGYFLKIFDLYLFCL